MLQIVDNGLEPGGAASAVKECFLYDQWNRLVRAHSAAVSAGCATSRSNAVSPSVAPGSRDAYDETYSFDDLGRQTVRTDNLAISAGTTSYSYADVNHPHAVTSISGATTAAFSYNARGAMLTRAGAPLTYDTAARFVAYGSTDSYVVSATGQRLVRQTGTARTLYLPGIEITDTSGSRSITRNVDINGVLVAVTTNASTVEWNCGDLQNSIVCQAPTPGGATPPVPARRRYLPWGGPRNTITFPNTDRGFLGQPADTTGLNYLNNRYYDPTVGVFLSVDPLVAKTGQPYLYAAGNPTTLSDPSGLEPGCSPNAPAGACGTEHGEQERIRPSYLQGASPQQSAQVRQVQDYANVCMNQWQWCVDSLANNDSHPVYGPGGALLGGEDLGLMSSAVTLLMMLIGQGLAYIDGSGSGAVLRPGNLPNGNNTMAIAVYGTSVSDMTMVASTWHIGARERFTPLLQTVSLVADGVAVIGGATCAFTAGAGCGVAAGATAVLAAANAGVATLNCTTGHQQTCGFAVAGVILSGAQLGAGSIAGKALSAGRLPVEIYQSLNAYSAITTSFFDVLSLNVPTGDGGEMGSVNIFRMTSGA